MNPSPPPSAGAPAAPDGAPWAERLRYVEHAGKSIFLADVSECTAEQMMECIRLVPQHVTRQPGHSVLLLADFTGAEFTRENVEALKVAAAFDQPHVAKAAWVLSDNLPKVLLESIQTFSAREIATFSTRAEALQYLVS